MNEEKTLIVFAKTYKECTKFCERFGINQTKTISVSASLSASVAKIQGLCGPGVWLMNLTDIRGLKASEKKAWYYLGPYCRSHNINIVNTVNAVPDAFFIGGVRP